MNSATDSDGPMARDERIYLDLGDRRVIVRGSEQTVGRSQRCGVVIDDRSVSREHARLKLAFGKLTVTDLGSSNGTFLNGGQVQGNAELHDGDELLFGEARATVRWVPSTHRLSIPVEELTAAVDERFSDPSPRPRRPGPSDTQPIPEPAASLVPEPPKEPLPRQELPPRQEPAVEEPEVELWAPDETPHSEASEHAAATSAEAIAEGSWSPELTDLSDLPELPPLDQSPTEPSASRGAQGDLGEPVPSAMGRRVLPSVSPGSRMAAGLFDFVLVAAPALVGSLLYGGIGTAAGRWLAIWVAVAVGATICFVGWTFFGATPGQKLVGLAVSDEQGRTPPPVGRALARVAGLALTVASLGLGFLLALFHPQGLALHDLVSKTFVIHR